MWNALLMYSRSCIFRSALTNPAFSTPALWTCIYRSCIFLFCTAFRSLKLDIIFPAFYGPAFSRLAFSSPLSVSINAYLPLGLRLEIKRSRSCLSLINISKGLILHDLGLQNRNLGLVSVSDLNVSSISPLCTGCVFGERGFRHARNHPVVCEVLPTN